MRKNKKKLAVEWLDEHFGEVDLDDLVVFRHIFPLWMRVDVQAAILDFFSRKPDHKFFGCRITETEGEFRFPNLLEDGDGAIAVGPPVYTMLDLGDGEPVQTQLRGLWLDEQDGLRYGVLCETTIEHWNAEFRVELAVPPGDQGRQFALAFIDKLILVGRRADTFKGRILIPSSNVPEGMLVRGSVDFTRVPLTTVIKEDIILDQRTADLFESNTMGFIAQVDALSKLGFSARKGVLLYGPPGTGKTLLLRYLVGQLQGWTRFILTPDSFELISQIMEAARWMSPCLIVIEDVDLIAENREYAGQTHPSLLNCLLNEMDGLTPDSQVLFLLTTNRPDVLEPALASRPGRIDQAIEIGLPADDERRHLLGYFAKSIPLSEEVIARVSQRTSEASPAFLKELVRRSIQKMLEENSTTLDFKFFQDALNNMVKGGGKIGAQLIGAKGIGFV